VQRVVGIPDHQQIAGAVRAWRSVAHDIALMQKAYLDNTGVVALYPLVTTGGGAEEGTVLAYP